MVFTLLAGYIINTIKYPCNILIFVSGLPKPKIFTFCPFKRKFANSWSSEKHISNKRNINVLNVKIRK